MREELEKKKEYLRRYGNAKRAIRRIQESIEELRSMKTSPSINMDGMPHASGVSDLSGYAAMVDEYEQKLAIAKEERINAFEEVNGCIESLADEVVKDVLNGRYIKMMDWEDIGTHFGISERQVFRFHRIGIETIDIL